MGGTSSISSSGPSEWRSGGVLRADREMARLSGRPNHRRKLLVLEALKVPYGLMARSVPDEMWRFEIYKKGGAHLLHVGPWASKWSHTAVIKHEPPEWVADKVAALDIMPRPFPSLHVDGVGLRVSETVYWLVR